MYRLDTYPESRDIYFVQAGFIAFGKGAQFINQSSFTETYQAHFNNRLAYTGLTLMVYYHFVLAIARNCLGLSFDVDSDG